MSPLKKKKLEIIRKRLDKLDNSLINIIKKIRPQFLFKGDDYKISQVVGAKEVKKWGGKVVLIKCIKGKSTSKIIERIKNGT